MTTFFQTTTTAQHVDQVPLHFVLGARLQYLRNPEVNMQRLERAYQRRKQNGLYNHQRKTKDKDSNESDHHVKYPDHPSDNKEEGTKSHRRHRHHHHHHNKPKDEDRNGSEQTKNEELDEEGKHAENEEPHTESDYQDNDHQEKLDNSHEKYNHEEDDHKKSHIDRRSPEYTESVSANEVTEKLQSWTSWIFGETAPEEELEEAEFVSSLLNENIVDEFQTAGTDMAESTDEILQGILQESSNLLVRRRRSPDDRLLSSVAVNKEASMNEETATDQKTADEQESSWWWWGSKPKTEDVQVADNVSTQLKEEIVDELTLAEPSEVGRSNSWFSNLFNYNYGQGIKQEPAGTELATTDDELQSSLSGTELATTDDQLQSSLYNTYLSPYSMLRYMLPEGESTDIAMNLLNKYTNSENISYWETAVTFARIMLLFMPAAGIVEQVNFSIAMTKILWKVSTMYYEGYGMSDIAVKILPELAAAYLVRTHRQNCFLWLQYM